MVEPGRLKASEPKRGYERLLGFVRPTPEELHAATEQQTYIRLALGAIAPHRAELLLLRSEGSLMTTWHPLSI